MKIWLNWVFNYWCNSFYSELMWLRITQLLLWKNERTKVQSDNCYAILSRLKVVDKSLFYFKKVLWYIELKHFLVLSRENGHFRPFFVSVEVLICSHFGCQTVVKSWTLSYVSDTFCKKAKCYAMLFFLCFFFFFFF